VNKVYGEPGSGGPLAPSGSSGDASEEDIPLHDEGTTRIDTFASYGQLLRDDYVHNGSRYGRESQEGSEADVFRRTSDAAAPPLQEQAPQQLQSPPAPSSKGSSHSATAFTLPVLARADRASSLRSGELIVFCTMTQVRLWRHVNSFGSPSAMMAECTTCTPVQADVRGAIPAAHHRQ
jgi:hypothetical protein